MTASDHKRDRNGRGSRPVVLLVENDDPQREIIRLTLLPLDLDLVEAQNLEEARKQLRAAGPALVILDFYLEPEAGTDLLDDIPEATPVLLLTASIETKSLERKHPRINALLRKPVDQEEFRSVVRRLLGLGSTP